MPYKFVGNKAVHKKHGKNVSIPKKQAIAILLSEKKKGKGQWAKKDENDSYLKPGMKDEKE
jgi:hypothetical protein